MPGTKVNPNASITVKGQLQPSGKVTLKKTSQGADFTFTFTDATLKDFKNKPGCTVSATKTAGLLNTTVTHNFSNSRTVLQLKTATAVGANVLTLDYSVIANGPPGDIDAAITRKPHKLAVTYNPALKKSAAVYTLDRQDYGLGIVGSNTGALLVTSTKKVNGDKYALSYDFGSDKVIGQWQHSPITVKLAAPVSTKGLGEATAMVLWEKPFVF